MQLVLVMVGLPARGKTYIARKIARYLSWRGYRTKVFNVGNYRRSLSGAQVPHSFFDPTNDSGVAARTVAADRARKDLKGWLHQGGQVAIYDATNSSKNRRDRILRDLDTLNIPVAFIESICDDPEIIASNIHETKLSSPDYVGMEPSRVISDFQARIAHYVSAYEPLENPNLRWIKIIDAGRQVIVNRADNHLISRIASFVMNLHVTPRTFWLTRHGQSQFNLQNRVGGDSSLSGQGLEYARSLKGFFESRQVDEIWSSTLTRTIETAAPVFGPRRQWKALDEIYAGECDGMTYEEIESQRPIVFAGRKKDKLRFRYPLGESYTDVIERLEPVIFELERRQQSTLVVAHQAVLRALYAYFVEKPLKDVPHLSMPLHTVIQLTPKTYGCMETRFALGPQLK